MPLLPENPLTFAHPSSRVYVQLLDRADVRRELTTPEKCQELIDAMESDIPHDLLPPHYDWLVAQRDNLARQGGRKTFYEMFNVGTARYTVSFHDGVKTHRDGSAFYDIRLFQNNREKERFINDLRQQGYTER